MLPWSPVGGTVTSEQEGHRSQPHAGIKGLSVCSLNVGCGALPGFCHTRATIYASGDTTPVSTVVHMEWVVLP